MLATSAVTTYTPRTCAADCGRIRVSRTSVAESTVYMPSRCACGAKGILPNGSAPLWGTPETQGLSNSSGLRLSDLQLLSRRSRLYLLLLGSLVVAVAHFQARLTCACSDFVRGLLRFARPCSTVDSSEQRSHLVSALTTPVRSNCIQDL